MSDTPTEPPVSAYARFTGGDAKDILGYTRSELAEVIRATGRQITEYGWCQGTTKDAWGHFCLVGALQRVTAQGHIYGAAMSCLWDQLIIDGNSEDLSPIAWNDANDRTVDQVLALCAATAERLDQMS